MRRFLFIFLIPFILSATVGSWMGVQKCLADRNGFCISLHSLTASVFGTVVSFLLFAFVIGTLVILEVRNKILIYAIIIVTALIAYGGSYFQKIELKRSSLAAAIEKWDVEEARTWLNRGASPNSIINASEATALFRAVELQNLSMVNLLLEKGADPKRGHCSIYCPMYMAYRRWSKDIISSLRAHGAKAPCLHQQKELISKYDIKPTEFDH